MSLPTFSLPPAFLEKSLRFTAICTVSLAAFLSFSIQPLIGKLLLPGQGGSASAWIGTLVYFQLSLLLGYGWAVWLLRKRAIIQVGATTALGLVAMLTCRLAWVQQSSWTGVSGVILTLALSSLPAMVLLLSAGPLMEAWLSRRGQPLPCHLYALPSTGGLAAVLLYPFTIERTVGLSDQMFFWQGFVWIFTGILCTAGYLFLVIAGSDHTDKAIVEKIPLSRMGAWLGLSALSWLGMLGATHHFSSEMSASPLAWVGPFGAFLLSFVVTFSGFWEPRYTLASLGWLAISLTGFMLSKGVSPATVHGGAAFWLVSLTASGSFFINGLLHALRPQKRFALFYLVLAAGGVAGGVFACFGAPFFFLRPSEIIVVSCVLLAVGLLQLTARRDVPTIAVMLIVVFAPVVGHIIAQTSAEALNTIHIRRFRNVYGYSMIKTEEGGTILSSETTIHGTQIITDQAARRHPTLYYTESSAIGRTITEIQKKSPAVNMGVAGVGAGTLAAYARPSDTVDFWDIDPKAIRIARDFFTYISDSFGRISVSQSDGRKAVESSSKDYDMIVIDAFTGEGIPAHLLTREALSSYFKRLENRHGLLVIHTSDRYNRFFPIVGATAHTLGRSCAQVTTEFNQPSELIDWDCIISQYIIVGDPEQIRQVVGWLPDEEDEGRIKRKVTIYDPQPPGRAVVWTDDRHAVLDALNLTSYLRGQ